MNTLEPSLSMIYIIVALAIIAVEQADRIHLFNLVIFVSDVDVLCNSLTCAIKDAL